jgi:maltose O-acetyltransferase
LRGSVHPDRLVEQGLQLGRDVYVAPGCVLDPGHCWLISIEDEVTLAPSVHILAHDASTKRHLGYTRIARVRICRRAFIGARAIILPGVTVGEEAIVGAGSVVGRDVEPGTIVAGNPAVPIGNTSDYIARHRDLLASRPRFPHEGFTVDGGIDDANRRRMRDELAEVDGYVE